MNREEAIAFMSETVKQVNMDLGYQHKVPMDELVKMMEQQHDQVLYINGIVYDSMKSKGLIAE
jgi:hypothetical protein